MTNERTYPILPCRELDESIFWQQFIRQCSGFCSILAHPNRNGNA